MVKNFAEAFIDFVIINSDDLKESAFDQAERFAVIADAQRQAFFQAADLKSKKNVLEGKLDEKIRSFYNAGLVEGAPDAKAKTKLTEAQITAKIQADPEYIAAVNACNEADSYLAFANNLLESMRHRKEMLALVFG
jgi:hypothetical protein